MKDVADYAFGLGSSLVKGEMSSLRDRVFAQAAAVLRPESMEMMTEEDIRRLKNAVSACGLSIQELRQLFIEQSVQGNEVSVQEIGSVEEAWIDFSE